jgi:hypothetical protein
MEKVTHKKIAIMKVVNKRTTDDAIKSLSKFYDRKRKEPSEGAFYMVKNASQVLGTYWGRSKRDVAGQLNKTRTKFDTINALA